MNFDGQNVILSELDFDPVAIDQFSRLLLPASVAIPPGSIHIATTAANNAGGLATFLAIGANKIFDLYLFLLLRDTPGVAIFTVYHGVAQDAGFDAAVRETYYWKICGSVLLELVFHGSLTRLYMQHPGVTKLLAQALRISRQEFHMDLLCSIPDFGKVRMPNLVVNIKDALPFFAEEVRGRFRIGVAGNRIWVFLNWLKLRITDFSGLAPVVRFMMQDEILARRPFISCHPMHPRNPFRNSSNHLKAYLGDYMRKRNIDMPEAKGETKKLLREWFIAPFTLDYGFATGQLPSLVDVIAATQDEYSLAGV